MTEHTRDCPKCNGSGKVTRKYIILKDKDKKFCPSCNQIYDRSEFYKKGRYHDSYCKKCKNSTKLLRSVRTQYALICEVCGKYFTSHRKQQISCTQQCHQKRMHYFRMKKLIGKYKEDKNK